MFNLFKKPQTESAIEPAEEKQGWWQRLTMGLQKSTNKLGDGISAIFAKKKLDEETLSQLEELLITTDLGPSTAMRLVENLRKSRFGKEVTDQEVRFALAGDIAKILSPYAREIDFSAARPFVLLMVGVNGVGKTTTMGKMARQLKEQGRSVLMVAGDTFRAAAVSQLQVWATRSGSQLLVGEDGSDPASLAYKALEKARSENIDIVMIDTAGRLHNKADLMAELQKIVRVIKKSDESAPHATLLVLDATTGQNAHAQVDIFSSMTPVSGLVLTKLDGSARGGVLVALAEKAKLPIVAVGIGEAVEDLQPFKADEYARALCGVEQEV
jgi:fused signal recognition particle receptor